MGFGVVLNAALHAAVASALAEHDFVQRARGLRWLLSDVDGVLTDGFLHYNASGETSKRFHVRDGLAFKLAQRAGLAVGLLTARGGPAVARRAQELGLDVVIERQEHKGAAFAAFCAERGLDPAAVAYVGDDLPDLPVFARCGLAFAPEDAAPEVRDRAHRVTPVRGGHGVIRAVVEVLLRARGQWDAVIAPYLAPP